jgi:pyrroline-5-carboxylate reductase
VVGSAVGTNVGRIAFLGGGFMGEGIVQGLLARGAVAPADISVCELIDARRRYLVERYGVSAGESATGVVRNAATLVIAVKPQDFHTLAEQLAGNLDASQLVLSIMAGVSITTLKRELGHDRLVRAMPNTPGAIGQGFTAWTATGAVTEAERARVSTVLEALGRSAYFADEKYLDMATAVSGSGPGFVLLLIEAVVEAAVLLGIRRDVATEMALQTFSGTALYAQQSDQHLAALRNAVTSPGGTTAAGLQVLERAGVRGAIADAIVAACERSRALGG